VGGGKRKKKRREEAGVVSVNESVCLLALGEKERGAPKKGEKRGGGTEGVTAPVDRCHRAHSAATKESGKKERRGSGRGKEEKKEKEERTFIPHSILSRQITEKEKGKAKKKKKKKREKKKRKGTIEKVRRLLPSAKTRARKVFQKRKGGKKKKKKKKRGGKKFSPALYASETTTHEGVPEGGERNTKKKKAQLWRCCVWPLGRKKKRKKKREEGPQSVSGVTSTKPRRKRGRKRFRRKKEKKKKKRGARCRNSTPCRSRGEKKGKT